MSTRGIVAALAILVAGCTDSSPVGVGGGRQEMEVTYDPQPTADTPITPPPTLRSLVMLDDGAEPVLAVARALLAEHAPEAGARIDSIVPLSASRGFVAPLTAYELAAVQQDARVSYAEEPREVTMAGPGPLTGPAGEGAFGQRTALLGLAGTPWALDRVTQRTLPLDGAASWDGSGAGVTIYVIDTGVRESHAEFGGRVTGGPDYILGGTSSGDCNGHGTKVASDAAGATMGTARQAKIVSVRVLDCNGSGSSVGVVQAIDWVVADVAARPGPAVINMSLGINGVCAPVNQAAARAVQAGIVVVAAAGNSNSNACSFSPAGEPTAVTVGATDAGDARASFSNYGSCVDLYAPGAGVDGAHHSGDAAYGSWSGTSAAAPFVAGIAALYVEEYPSATPTQVSAALVAGATPNVLKGTNATPNRLVYLPPSGSAPGEIGTPPGTFVSPPVARASILCTRRACTFDGRASSDGEAVTKWAWTYGNGRRGNGSTAAHTYKADSLYVVGLTVTNARGLTASRVDTVRIDDGTPTALGSVVCTGWSCRFDATRSTDDGKLTRYTWTFGDGSTTKTASPAITRTYKAAGTYPVTLTVTDDVTQTATVQLTATTTPRPPTVASRVTCVGRTCTFDGTGSRDDLAIASYTWDFLDGTLQVGATVTKTYAATGTKQFKLTVRNSSGLATTQLGKFTVS